MTTWLGWCHITAGDGEYEVPLAIGCSNSTEFDAVARQWLESQHWMFRGTRDVLSAAEWMAIYPDDAGAPLVDAVENGAALAVGTYVRLDPTHLSQNLQIETIDGVTPLGSQFGIWPKLTTPDPLRHALFGQLCIENRSTAAKPAASDKAMPELLTYALLDAGKLPFLLDLLEQSDLPFKCLFKGKAYDDLKDAAPYLVQLTEDHPFTRSLFTASGMPADLWDKHPGIYIRSPRPLDDLLTHFRKFTRLRDTRGQWYFWRFWEPAFFQTARHFIGSHWLKGMEFETWQQDCTVVYPANGQSYVVSPKSPPKPRTQIHPMALDVLAIGGQHADLRKQLYALPPDHWLVRHLPAIRHMSALGSIRIKQMMALGPDTPTQKICAALLSDRFLRPQDGIAALNHLFAGR